MNMQLRALAGKYRNQLLSLGKGLIRPFHELEYQRRLAGSDPSDSTPAKFLAGCSDEFLLWSLCHAWELGLTKEFVLPALPDPWHQRNWTGAAGEETMLPACEFFQLVSRMNARHGRVPLEKSRILDFGSGWGRILRFFLRDVPAANLMGRDCWEEIVAVASKDNPWCDFRHIGTFPPLPDADGSVDIVYLFSVFSHLSEAAHLAWLEEFRRVLPRGGLVIATTRQRDYLVRMDRNRARDRSRGGYQSMLAGESFPEIGKTLAEYDAGRFCYSGTGGGGPLDASFYGEAAIPVAYAKANWPGFEIVEAFPPRGAIDQLTLVARKL
jgi:SAM-dependent methyltransferase